jgi:phenylacetate-CoA ligase
MSWTRSLYDSSPVFLQNGMVSAYGLILKRLRYGAEFRDKLRELEASQRYGAEELAALRQRRLLALVEHASRHVPFFAAYLKDRGIPPRAVNLENFSSLLPIIRKDALRKSPGDFRSSAFRKGQLSTVHTSGTTGTPLDIVSTKSAIRENYAFFFRFLGWAGIRPGDAGASFACRILIPPGQSRPPYWRKNRAMNNTLFSSYHISEETLPHYIRELERIRPVFIDSYPSAIFVLAQYLRERGLAHRIRPKSIVTSSETLLEPQRKTIEEAFGCRVYDQYGSAEMAAFLSQCEQGSYHVHPEYGLVEIVDTEGRPLPAGETGEMVCTGFLNHAMPMLRYRIGDSAAMSKTPCACGRNFPVIESILGRTDDMLVTPDGRHIGRLDPIFKGLDSIREAQIVQIAPDAVTIKVVPGEGYEAAMGGKLVEQLGVRLGPLVKITLDPVSSIPRTAAGKFRSVVSMVKNRE